MSEERIAYEELRPETEVQAGDQYRNTQGRWVEYSLDTSGVPIVGPTAMARRPYRISTILEIGDALANAQKAATQLQAERDEARKERDLARAEVARLSTELWARKPLEDRVTSLTDELAQAREGNQQLQDERDKWQRQFAAERSAREVAIAERNVAERLLGEARMERDKAWSDQKAIQDYRDTALQKLGNAEQALSEERAAHAQTRNKRDRLQGLIDDLLDEPTARQVQDMLRTWATELDWSAGCFDSVGREQIDTIQKTLVAVIERIEGTLNPEGGTDDN